LPNKNKVNKENIDKELQNCSIIYIKTAWLLTARESLRLDQMSGFIYSRFWQILFLTSFLTWLIFNRVAF